MTFIEIMKSDWKWRSVDLIGHMILALVLPGKWWFQFLPDILVPVLFMHGWITGRLITSKDNFVLRVLLLTHKNIHSVLMPVCFILGAFIGYTVSHSTKVVGLLIGCQWLGHIIWDGFTHKLDWQKKAIW